MQCSNGVREWEMSFVFRLEVLLSMTVNELPTGPGGSQRPRAMYPEHQQR